MQNVYSSANQSSGTGFRQQSQQKQHTPEAKKLLALIVPTPTKGLISTQAEKDNSLLKKYIEILNTGKELRDFQKDSIKEISARRSNTKADTQEPVPNPKASASKADHAQRGLVIAETTQVSTMANVLASTLNGLSRVMKPLLVLAVISSQFGETSAEGLRGGRAKSASYGSRALSEIQDCSLVGGTGNKIDCLTTGLNTVSSDLDGLTTSFTAFQTDQDAINGGFSDRFTLAENRLNTVEGDIATLELWQDALAENVTNAKTAQDAVNSGFSDRFTTVESDIATNTGKITAAESRLTATEASVAAQTNTFYDFVSAQNATNLGVAGSLTAQAAAIANLTAAFETFKDAKGESDAVRDAALTNLTTTFNDFVRIQTDTNALVTQELQAQNATNSAFTAKNELQDAAMASLVTAFNAFIASQNTTNQELRSDIGGVSQQFTALNQTFTSYRETQAQIIDDLQVALDRVNSTLSEQVRINSGFSTTIRGIQGNFSDFQHTVSDQFEYFSNTTGSLRADLDKEVADRNAAISTAFSHALSTNGTITVAMTNAITQAITDPDGEIATAISNAVGLEATARNTAISDAIANALAANGTISTAITDAISDAITDSNGEIATAISNAVGLEATARNTAISDAISDAISAAFTDPSGEFSAALTTALTAPNGTISTAISDAISAAFTDPNGEFATAITKALTGPDGAISTAINTAIADSETRQAEIDRIQNEAISGFENDVTNAKEAGFFLVAPTTGNNRRLEETDTTPSKGIYLNYSSAILGSGLIVSCVVIGLLSKWVHELTKQNKALRTDTDNTAVKTLQNSLKHDDHKGLRRSIATKVRYAETLHKKQEQVHHQLVFTNAPGIPDVVTRIKTAEQTIRTIDDKNSEDTTVDDAKQYETSRTLMLQNHGPYRHLLTPYTAEVSRRRDAIAFQITAPLNHGETHQTRHQEISDALKELPNTRLEPGNRFEDARLKKKMEELGDISTAILEEFDTVKGMTPEIRRNLDEIVRIKQDVVNAHRVTGELPTAIDIMRRDINTSVQSAQDSLLQNRETLLNDPKYKSLVTDAISFRSINQAYDEDSHLGHGLGIAASAQLAISGVLVPRNTGDHKTADKTVISTEQLQTIAEVLSTYASVYTAIDIETNAIKAAAQTVIDETSAIITKIVGTSLAGRLQVRIDAFTRPRDSIHDTQTPANYDAALIASTALRGALNQEIASATRTIAQDKTDKATQTPTLTAFRALGLQIDTQYTQNVDALSVALAGYTLANFPTLEAATPENFQALSAAEVAAPQMIPAMKTEIQSIKDAANATLRLTETRNKKLTPALRLKVTTQIDQFNAAKSDLTRKLMGGNDTPNDFNAALAAARDLDAAIAIATTTTAATKLQTKFRTHRAETAFKKEKADIETVQRAFRVHKAKQALATKKTEKAATEKAATETVQRAFRTFQAKQVLATKKTEKVATETVQRAFRTFQAKQVLAAKAVATATLISTAQTTWAANSAARNNLTAFRNLPEHAVDDTATNQALATLAAATIPDPLTTENLRGLTPNERGAFTAAKPIAGTIQATVDAEIAAIKTGVMAYLNAQLRADSPAGFRTLVENLAANPETQTPENLQAAIDASPQTPIPSPPSTPPESDDEYDDESSNDGSNGPSSRASSGTTGLAQLFGNDDDVSVSEDVDVDGVVDENGELELAQRMGRVGGQLTFAQAAATARRPSMSDDDSDGESEDSGASEFSGGWNPAAVLTHQASLMAKGELDHDFRGTTPQGDEAV